MTKAGEGSKREGGVLPQQGKRISQKVGLGLSRAEKRREGKGKAKNPSHPALLSKGGQEAAPGSEKARRPAYRKTTPRLQGQNQEQTETIKGSDSKVNLTFAAITKPFD